MAYPTEQIWSQYWNPRQFRNPDGNSNSGNSSSSGNVSDNENNQIGLINNNVQANLNVSLISSGGIAGATSLIGGAAAATTTTTTIIGGQVIQQTVTQAAGIAWIPVVGQVVAVAAAIVGIAQAIDTADKQATMQRKVNRLNEMLRSQQVDVAIQTEAEKAYIKMLQDNIEVRKEALATNKFILIGTVTILGVSGMILTYLATRRKK
tara:strand:- start:1600 stop:2220 length:621 start_codon:yes stop_codon:yes gene_type:complete